MLGLGSRGSRLYTVAEDQETSHIDSPCESVTAGKNDAEKLKDVLKKQLETNPPDLLHFRGHGHADIDVLGMKTSEFNTALTESTKATGKKFPVILLESCLMGNVNALQGLSDAAHFALVSEEVLNVTALPLERILGETKPDMSPRERALQIVEQVKGADKLDTLVAVDLSQLKQVGKATEKLKAGLRSEIENGKGKEVRDTLRACEPFPRKWNTGYQKSLRGKLGLRDVGDVGNAIEKSDLSESTKEAAEMVKGSADRAIIGKALGKGYESGLGLSLRTDDLLPNPASLSGLWYTVKDKLS